MITTFVGSGRGRRNPRAKGAGSLRDAGQERAGIGIHKVAGTGSNRSKCYSIAITENRKSVKGKAPLN